MESFNTLAFIFGSSPLPATPDGATCLVIGNVILVCGWDEEVVPPSWPDPVRTKLCLSSVANFLIRFGTDKCWDWIVDNYGADAVVLPTAQAGCS